MSFSYRDKHVPRILRILSMSPLLYIEAMLSMLAHALQYKECMINEWELAENHE